MGDVHVRLFQVEVSLNAEGAFEVSGIATPYEVDLAVNLAKAVNVNCLATPATGSARYRTLRHEARLLACLLGTSSTSSALHLDSAFAWSARHIRGFVAECAGLGLLTAAAEEFFGWRANPGLLHHFDALPTRLIPRYGSNGIRPDLLFDLGDWGRIAGEAKGRSRKPPTKVLAEQIKYMNKLLYWSHRNDDHPVVLSCAFLTPQGVTVDLFSLGSDTRSLLLRLVKHRGGAEWADRDTRPDPGYDAAIAQARREQAAHDRRRRRRDLADEEDGSTESVGEAGNTDDPLGNAVRLNVDSYRHLGWGDDVPSTAGRSSGRLTMELTRRAVAIEDELYRDAAELIASDQTVRRTLLGRSVVGSWVPLDLFAGARPSRQLFFGLLDEELSASVVDDLQVDRTRGRPSGDGNLDVDVTSRMVVAITKRSSASPPPWEEVQETLRRR